MSSAVRRYGILAAIVIVVLALAFVFRDRISGNAGELQVGECFDSPALEGTVTDVQHHPCTEAHTGEVFGVVKNPADSNAAFPDKTARIAFVTDNCAAPFLAYVGTPMDSSTLNIAYFGPTSDGWAKGDRSFTCYVETTTPVLTTVKGTKK